MDLHQEQRGGETWPGGGGGEGKMRPGSQMGMDWKEKWILGVVKLSPELSPGVKRDGKTLGGVKCGMDLHQEWGHGDTKKTWPGFAVGMDLE